MNPQQVSRKRNASTRTSSGGLVPDPDPQLVDKNIILDVLKKSIHNLLQSNELIDLVEIEDSIYTQNLCSAIEALFIQGQLKNQSFKLLSKISRRKHSYEYDFWNFIKGLIPKNLLYVLENHSFKLTAVGLSRVWLRFALNECTILSYIDSVRADTKRLQQFYSKDSLIRDDEKMETFCGLLTSIERIPFNLDTKSPLLNTWINSDALKIAGIEVLLTKNEKFELFNESNLNYDANSISSVTNEDIEEILTTSVTHSSKKYSQSVPKKEITFVANDSHRMSNNPFEESFEDENEFPEDCRQKNSETSIGDPETNIMEDFDTSTQSENDICHENNESIPEIFTSEKEIIYNDTLDNKPDSVEICENLSLDLSLVNSNTIVENSKSESNNINGKSYDELWSEHYLTTQKSNESARSDDILNSPLSNVTNNHEEPEDNSKESNSDILAQSKVYSSLIASKLITPTADFVYNLIVRRFNFPIFTVKESDQSWEFIGDDMITEKIEMKRLMDIFPGVDVCSTNDGLNSVFGGLCSTCSQPLETNKVIIDHYDGKLYCTNCQSGIKSVIPRNIIYNWDFNQKFVSLTTKRFLSEIMSHPNINLADHLTLFDVIPELSRVRQLRHKLNLLWLQVTSCDIETSKRIREAMFPRDYMLGSIKESDLYSIEDLIILHSGVLEKTLLFVINKIAIPHVKKCLICRMKTMACDKCRDEKKVIYIHEIDEYCECSTPSCKSVIHKECKSPTIVSFYCRRCIQHLKVQQPITFADCDSANCYK